MLLSSLDLVHRVTATAVAYTAARVYRARIDGQPAATATLLVREGVGHLAEPATVPASRNRGLHAAMLHRRMRGARDAGVDLLRSGADILSTSHRNMEPAGMRRLFLRPLWTADA